MCRNISAFRLYHHRKKRKHISAILSVNFHIKWSKTRDYLYLSNQTATYNNYKWANSVHFFSDPCNWHFNFNWFRESRECNSSKQNNSHSVIFSMEGCNAIFLYLDYKVEIVHEISLMIFADIIFKWYISVRKNSNILGTCH